MFEWVLLLIGLVGFGSAGYLDLKTTEFPDWLPYSIIIASLAIYSVASFALNDLNIIISSVIVGLVFLGFGYLLYLLRQWGDGDAWLLGALGFLFPQNWFAASQVLPFPLTLITNFFVISFIYLIGYSVVIGAINKAVRREFVKSVERDAKAIVGIVLGFLVAITILVVALSYVPGIFSLFYFPLLLLLALLFFRYALIVEKLVFRKKVSVSSLKEGDVPEGSRWRVLTKKELERLRKKGGTIWVKEGVRLAPVFVITLVVSILFGNLLVRFI